MDNPEKQATLSTRHKAKTNREIKTQHGNLKRRHHAAHPETWDEPKKKSFLLLSSLLTMCVSNEGY